MQFIIITASSRVTTQRRHNLLLSLLRPVLRRNVDTIYYYHCFVPCYDATSTQFIIITASSRVTTQRRHNLLLSLLRPVLRRNVDTIYYYHCFVPCYDATSTQFIIITASSRVTTQRRHNLLLSLLRPVLRRNVDTIYSLLRPVLRRNVDTICYYHCFVPCNDATSTQFIIITASSRVTTRRRHNLQCLENNLLICSTSTS